MLEKKIKIIMKELKTLFPNPKIALNYKTDFELLVAVILSAQCTDKKVNEVTKTLFKKYKTLNDYIDADIKEFENDIKSIGLYKSKSKNILDSARLIHSIYRGIIPDQMNELVKLPGVGRKTANIVLSILYNKFFGIAVDTHVKRLSIYFGLTQYTDPINIEKDLMKLVSKQEWSDFSIRLILYGRQYLPAHKCKSKYNNDPISKALNNL